MNRRRFIGSAVVAAITGPRALASLLESQRREALIIEQLRYQGQQAINAISIHYTPQEWDVYGDQGLDPRSPETE